MNVSTDWLKKINQELSAAGVEHKRRPVEAILRYSLLFKNIPISDEVSKEIYDWFQAHIKQGVLQIECRNESIYFFDAEFWVIYIPIHYGSINIDILSCLRDMPTTIKNEIIASSAIALEYKNFWDDCYVYEMGLGEIISNKKFNKFGIQTLEAADQHLKTAVKLLKDKSSDSQSAQTCTLAFEIFLKAYLVIKYDFTEEKLISLNHHLKKIFKEILKLSNNKNWLPIESKIKLFPKTTERYKKQILSKKEIWELFLASQTVGAIIVRELMENKELEQVI